ncbi:hypothetical protein BG004_004640 [Podila humilis]|nr:hypothetical protein BG004_004640 [Podila humilis]
MHSRTLLSIVILAIFGFMVFQAQAAPPPPPSTNVLKLLSPNEDVTYYVHDNVHVHVELVGGKKNPLYKKNAEIKFYLQRRITYPKLNVHVATVKAKDLFESGEAVFVIKKEYIIEEQKSIPNRVRASWDGGYSDSKAFWVAR